ncbi:histidine kinase [Paenibacillus sp. SI8]|uniref:sensor histidine kinase n=1 Tax=unclassified Paenibacillus TaxID=185978 RepID=UPI0034674A78
MRSKSLSSRLISIFFSVTLLLLIILITVSNYAKHVVLSQVSQSYQNFVNSNIQIIDNNLEKTEKSMLYIANQDENFRILGTYGLNDSTYYFAQIDLNQKNSSYQTYLHNVDMFFLYSVPNKMLVTTATQGASSRYANIITQRITQMMEQQSSIKDYLYKWNVIQIGDQYYLYRLIDADIQNDAYIGALINVNSLKAPLSNLDLGKDGEMVFTSVDGKILSDREVPGHTFQQLPTDDHLPDEPFSVGKGQDQILIVNQLSQKVPLRLAVILPNANLLKGLPYFQAVIYILPVLVLGILLLYLFLIRKLLLTPIYQLLSVIRKIKMGDMNARLPETTSTDFSIIHQSFNTMVDEITHLQINVYEERLRAQKSELKHLQAQINPHFFLNTLNIIFQLADMKRYDLVKKTVHHLVQYFRFLMTSKRDTITIEQELAHIRNYLEIQKMRYQDSFHFDIQISGHWEHMHIPPLIVQPFVENAMIHGFSVKDHPFSLQVAVKNALDDSGRIQIEIRDNGNGFTEEHLAELGTYAPVKEDNHIGISNVKKRLIMRYGEGQTEIRFANVVPRGAMVTILLPSHHREGGN